MRICLVYDCLFPCTVGGAERWYRALAERLVEAGHSVTYLTMRQWDDRPPYIPGVQVIAVAPRMQLYVGGRRSVLPPLLFGAGVAWHLARRGRQYDAVHTASFPYFSLLAAAPWRRIHDFRLLVDWHEVWTREYWREYLGPAGFAGWAVQRLCLRLRQRAFCFSRLHERRLHDEGLRGPVTLLEGEYAGPLSAVGPAPAEPYVLFAGRHIPEKRVPALVPAIAEARRSIPDLRCVVLGDGPDREELVRLIHEHGLDEAFETPGFVPAEEVAARLERALCVVLPSRREGYGLIVVEAMAHGVPAVVVRAPDNAATELIEDGRNGVIAESAAPAELAGAIRRIHEGGHALRESTAHWFNENARRLSLEGSLAKVEAAHYDLNGGSHR